MICYELTLVARLHADRFDESAWLNDHVSQLEIPGMEDSEISYEKK